MDTSYFLLAKTIGVNYSTHRSCLLQSLHQKHTKIVGIMLPITAGSEIDAGLQRCWGKQAAGRHNQLSKHKHTANKRPADKQAPMPHLKTGSISLTRVMRPGASGSCPPEQRSARAASSGRMNSHRRCTIFCKSEAS